MTHRAASFALALLTLAVTPIAVGQHQHDAATQTKVTSSAPDSSKDSRVLVQFPDAIKTHTLTSMRDHLSVISQLQSAVAAEQFDEAARIAETKLGMSSLSDHGAHESSKYMPKGMQEVGSLMHRSASQFAIEAQNSAATGDGKKALAALSKVTSACVACHASYRLQ